MWKHIAAGGLDQSLLLLCALTLLDEGLGELVFPLHADDVAHDLHPLWGCMERL